MKPSALPNPKQNGASRYGRAGWYPYYAGYCPRFVEQLLARTTSGDNLTILDPWNGAGTTTQVAHDLGHRAIGFDLNPVAHTVAKARLANGDLVGTLTEQLPLVVQRARAFRATGYFNADPLGDWFSDRAVTAIRHLDRAIREEFACGDAFVLSPEPIAAADVSACFCYTALFRVLRRLTQVFRGSNPTWLKTARTAEQRVDAELLAIANLFLTETRIMLDALREEFGSATAVRNGGECRLGVEASHRLPLQNDEVDIVVASPPYCTRIDYVVSTSVELAVLGVGRNETMRCLRNSMTGTSTIRPQLPNQRPEWGSTCNQLLTSVSEHGSKASQSYYLKGFLQYFHDIYESLEELDRCIRNNGHCILVVQDSYYKNLQVQLPLIFQEMGASLGWTVYDRRDFPVPRNMLRVNTRSHHYRLAKAATETVLWFTT